MHLGLSRSLGLLGIDNRTEPHFGKIPDKLGSVFNSGV